MKIKNVIYKDNVDSSYSSYFHEEEFGCECKIRPLCDAIRKDKVLEENEECGTVAALNQLLERVDLCSTIMNRKKPKDADQSKELKALEKTYDRTKEKEDLRRLNRSALELSYRDETPKRKTVTELCRNETYQIVKGDLKKLPAELEDHKPGCFLAGRVEFSFNQRSYEILLVDTSDYYGYAPAFKGSLLEHLVDIIPPFLKPKTEYRGMKTWISYSEEWRSRYESGIEGRNIHQTGWFKEMRAEDKSILTLVASHYTPRQLISQLLDEDKIKLCEIFEKPHGDSTNGTSIYWVSAHTHTDIPEYEEMPVRCNNNKEYRIHSLNIGSTTDFIPQGVIMTIDPEATTPEIKVFQWPGHDKRNAKSRQCKETKKQKNMKRIPLDKRCCNAVVYAYQDYLSKEFYQYPKDYLADNSIAYYIPELRGFVMDDPQEDVRHTNEVLREAAYNDFLSKPGGFADDEDLMIKLDGCKIGSSEKSDEKRKAFVKQCLAANASEEEGAMEKEDKKCYSSFSFSVSEFTGTGYSATDLCRKLLEHDKIGFPSTRAGKRLKSAAKQRGGNYSQLLHPESCVYYLNEWLKDDQSKCCPGSTPLYEKLANKLGEDSKISELKELKKLYEDRQVPPERLNRGVLEVYYPDNTPRDSKVWDDLKSE